MKIKTVVSLILALCLLGGCIPVKNLFTPSIFDKVESCGECFSGSDELENILSRVKTIKATKSNK